jgi:aquaporin Z
MLGKARLLLAVWAARISTNWPWLSVAEPSATPERGGNGGNDRSRNGAGYWRDPAGGKAGFHPARMKPRKYHFFLVDYFNKIANNFDSAPPSWPPKRGITNMSNTQRAGAEFLGTFWLTFGGCGSAVLAAGFPTLGIGFAGVALAFGLTVLTMAYAVGHISGGHFNPAITIGLWAGGRFKAGDIPLYVVAQVAGAIVAAAVLYLIASGKPDFVLGGFAANGYGDLSPGKYPLLSCLVMEVVATFAFLMIILGVTSPRAPVGFAPIAIGLALTLIHLISIPVTNTSVNPARSTGPALFAGGEYLSQLWLFWVAPIVGALLAGWVSRLLQKD